MGHLGGRVLGHGHIADGNLHLIDNSIHNMPESRGTIEMRSRES